MSYPCDGCGGEENVTETLWLNAPLGLTAVHVHRDRACAEAARASRGGGKFRDGPPESKAEKLKRQSEEASGGREGGRPTNAP